MKDVLFDDKPKKAKPVLALPALAPSHSVQLPVTRASYKNFYHTLTKAITERKPGDFALLPLPVV